MTKIENIVFVLSVFFGLCSTANILAVFPVPSISHQVVFRPITQELARRGHEVIVITTDPVYSKEEALENLTEIDVHDLSYEIWTAEFQKSTSNENNDVYSQMELAFHLMLKVFEAQMKTEKVTEIFKKPSNYFDLIIVEAISRPAYMFTHVFKAPAVMVSSFGAAFNQLEVFGVPDHFFLYPEPTRQKLNDLSILDKISELIRVYKINQIAANSVSKEDKALQKILGPAVPSIEVLKHNFDMFFLNTFSLWDTNRPVPPNIIYMGGLHQKQHKQLPQDLNKYLDESKNGVIYISFGTNVSPSLFPQSKIKIMVNVLSKLPYNVLWKWDKDVLPGQTKNIKIGKWFPQSDLLRHPNVKLFIMQGGLQSTDEAITAGVPLLGMPMLGDQWYNVEKYKTLKIGERIDLENLTEEKFKNFIENIIKNKRYDVATIKVRKKNPLDKFEPPVPPIPAVYYRENIKILRDKIQDQPMSSLDKTIWWMEYVIRHKGAKHLRSPAAGIPWADYFELKLVFTVLSIVLAIVISVALVVAYLYKLLLSRSSKVKKN